MLSIRKIIYFFSLVFLTESTFAVNSDIDKICSTKLTNEHLVGVYNIIVGPGTVSMSGMSMPYPESPKLPAKIFEIDNELALSSDDGSQLDMTLSIVRESEPQWHFSKSKTFQTPHSDDLGLILGCETSDLPRISGVGSFISADKMKVSSTMKLIVFGVSDNGIDAVGVMNSNADGVTFKVRISLEGGGLISADSQTSKKENRSNKRQKVTEVDKNIEKSYQENIQKQREIVKKVNDEILDRHAQEKARQRIENLEKANEKLIGDHLYNQEMQRRHDDIQKGIKELLDRQVEEAAGQRIKNQQKANEKIVEDLYKKEMQRRQDDIQKSLKEVKDRQVEEAAGQRIKNQQKANEKIAEDLYKKEVQRKQEEIQKSIKGLLEQ